VGYTPDGTPVYCPSQDDDQRREVASLLPYRHSPASPPGEIFFPLFT
jgi:hypothetical protein